MKHHEILASRKRYEKPSVIFYGDIRQIAQAISNKSNNKDGGTGSNQKTA